MIRVVRIVQLEDMTEPLKRGHHQHILHMMKTIRRCIFLILNIIIIISTSFILRTLPLL